MLIPVCASFAAMERPRMERLGVWGDIRAVRFLEFRSAPAVAGTAENAQLPERVATPGEGDDVVGGQVVGRAALFAPRVRCDHGPGTALVGGAVAALGG